MAGLGDLQKQLPLLTAVALVGCLAFAGGYMKYAGTSWITLFEITDIFSLSWPVAPFLIASSLAGYAFGKMPSTKTVPSSNPTPTNSTTPQKTSNKLVATAMLVALAGMHLSLLLPADYGVAAILVPVLPLGILFFSVLKRRIDFQSGMAAGAVVALISCICFGIAYGSMPYSSSPKALVRLSDDQPICANIVLPFRRGLLITRDGETTEFLEWRHVAQITTGERCDLQSGQDA